MLGLFYFCSQNALPDVLNSPVGDFNFTNVIGKLGDVMYKFPFSLPPFYIAIIRCLGVLEGLALQVHSVHYFLAEKYGTSKWFILLFFFHRCR